MKCVERNILAFLVAARGTSYTAKELAEILFYDLEVVEEAMVNLGLLDRRKWNRRHGDERHGDERRVSERRG